MTANENDIPKWITQKCFENVLKLYKKDDTIEVKVSKADYATKKGEGHASAMIRVTADYYSNLTMKDETSTCLIKIPFDENCLAYKCLKEFDVYNHEMAMYSKYLPALKSVLIESQIDDYFYPETIHVDYEHSAIILQDLKVENFKLPDSIKGLNRKQTEMVLEKLARMHAASAKVNELSPGIFKSLDRGLHCRHTQGFCTYFEDSLDNCIRVASEWPGYDICVEKMKKLRPNLMEYIRRCFDMKTHFFNVLVHGDLWTNNIMFQYDNTGGVLEVVLFDYQFSCYTSPAIDVMYFINTSVEDDFHLNRQEDFIRFYYQELTKNLHQLNFGGKILTLDEFIEQYDQDSFYWFVSCCLAKPMFCSDHCGDADFEALNRTVEKSYLFRKKLFDDHKIQEILKVWLPIFNRKGILNIK